MVTIESEIDKFFAENEQSVASIIDGSDEHLDMILAVTKPLNQLATKFEKINELLYSQLRLISNEELRVQLMPKLRHLNKSCVTFIGALRTSFLYRDVRSALKEYTRHYDFFREMLHDLHHFRLSQNNELDNLLKEINEL